MEYLLSNKDIDRRVFIKGIGFVSVSLLLGTLLGGCESCIEAIKKRPTRRRLRTGSAEVDADIETYREAVSLMKGLPSGDPRSWNNQAGIHGTVSGGFNFCQHGTDHFFSWHRGYLFYFEKICQKLTGNADFGLPYWNWNQNPDINPAFLNAASPLFHPRGNTSMAGVGAVSTPTLDPIFSDGNFFTFSSQLEGTPHNTVHIWIGAGGADMASGGSALDPIFWTHHCMIDYCWAKWNIELENDNTNDPTWNGTSWDHFVDQDGNPASVTAGPTILMPLLSYQYESSAIGSSGAVLVEKTKSDFKRLEKRLKEGADVKFEIKQRIPIADGAAISIGRPFSKETQVSVQDFSRLINSDINKENIFASIEYAQLPPTSDFYVRVFMNMPTANVNTPTDDPHYAGSFAFFGTHTEGKTKHQDKLNFLVNITNTLKKLRQIGELKDNSRISVQLVAVPVLGQFEKPDTELILEKIELIVTPVIVRGK